MIPSKIPRHPIQGGFDMKFESSPYDVDLKGIVTSEQYTDIITSTINHKLQSSWSGPTIDSVLLMMGSLIVPLMVWDVRHDHHHLSKILLQIPM
jgi:hypothetical protein